MFKFHSDGSLRSIILKDTLDKYKVPYQEIKKSNVNCGTPVLESQNNVMFKFDSAIGYIEENFKK